MQKKWMKPLIIVGIVLLIVVIICIALSAGGNEIDFLQSKVVSTKQNEDYRYNVYDDDSIGIISYLGKNKIITVPEHIDDMPVTRIEDNAFKGKAFTAIVLPETMLRIGDKAFYGCEELTSLTIPESVMVVGKDAFLIEKNNSTSFIPWVYSRDSDYVVVGDGILIAYIGEAPENMEIPEEVKFITRFYFRGEAIQTLTLPDDLRSIGDSAFENFKKIESVELPSSLTDIGKRAFYNCQSLTEISLPDSVWTVGDQAFACCPRLTSVETDGVEQIGNGAFAYCLNLSEIELPDTLTKIGDEAFTDCSSLLEIVIPDSVVSLGSDALHGTAWMLSKKNETFVVTDNGMLVEYNGKGGQISVEKKEIRVIADAFAGKKNIQNIILGNNVTEIAPRAFENCPDLEAVITSKYLQSVGERAFANCKKLTQVDLLEGVSSIGEYAFENCTALKTITLPSPVTVIPKGCFAGCTALGKINLSDALTTIETNAFLNCKSLREITLTEELLAVKKDAFKGSKLTKVHYDGSNWQKKDVEVADAVFKKAFG